MSKFQNIWYHSVLKSIKKPILFAIIAFGSSLVAEHFIDLYSLELAINYEQLNRLIVIATIAWFFFEMINRLEENWVLTRDKKSKIDFTTASAITKILRILAMAVFGIMGMQVFGFSLSALWAFAGGGGVVAGFAAKDMLSNFFGALSIYLDKPFKVGDWISSPDKQIEGTVEEIGLRITKLRTLDKKPLYVQNSVFNTISIENPSNMSHRRLKEIVGVRFQDLNKVPKITDDIKAMLKKNVDIDEELPVVANLDSYSSTSVNISVIAFTRVTDMEPYFEFKQKILLEIAKIIVKNKAKIAQLYTAIHVPEDH